MKAIFRNVVFTALIVAGSIIPANAQDAVTILKKMADVMYSPKDMTGENTIILIDKSGNEEVRKATIKQKGTDKRIFRFTSPASQGRIASRAKNQNFAGTDFSYDDMESVPFSDKYTPKLLKTEEDSIFVLELTPQGRSDYSKVVVTIDKEHYYPMLTEYYDKGGNKVKKAKYTFKKIGNYWNAAEIEITDLKKNHKTKMQIPDVKYDTGLSDDEFTVRKLIQ